MKLSTAEKATPIASHRGLYWDLGRRQRGDRLACLFVLWQEHHPRGTGSHAVMEVGRLAKATPGSHCWFMAPMDVYPYPRTFFTSRAKAVEAAEEHVLVTQVEKVLIAS